MSDVCLVLNFANFFEFDADIIFNYLYYLFSGFIISFLVFVPLERLLALKKEQKIFREGWLTDFFHLTITKFYLKACIGVTTYAFVYYLNKMFVFFDYLKFPYLGDAFLYLRATMPNQNKYLQIAILFFINELLFYTYHRMAHKYTLLWRFHSIHHSSRDLDWLSTYRSHPLEYVVFASFSSILTISLNLSPEALYLTGFVYAFMDPFVHSNIRLNLRPLSWVLVTPDFHHWHHSTSPEAYNKNFANRFAIIDRILGTAYSPKDKVADDFGIDEPAPVKGLMKHLIYPFKFRQNLLKPFE